MSADDAETKCKTRFEKLPTEGELFETGLSIYVDYIVEIGGVPSDGIVLRYARYRGELSSISKSFPLGDGGGMLASASYLTNDPGDEQTLSAASSFVVLP
jgi:hypothetical protein